MTMKKRTQSIALIALFVSLITVSAWISVPLVIPVTLQTSAVCLSSATLRKKAVVAVLCYILLGAVGVPVFSGFQGGFSVLLGPTGGYITGFILTSLLVGIFAEKAENSIVKMTLLMIAGILLCYLFGTVWFACVYGKNEASLTAAITACVLPFIIPDIIKAAFASVVSRKINKLMHI